MTTIGFIGSGNIGSGLARLAVAHGHDVVLSNSRGPDTLADLVTELGDHARAATVAEAARAGDVIVLSVPLRAVRDIPAEPLAGRVVIDTTNYYPQRDGHIEALDRNERTTSQLVQDHLTGATVVKAFNHLYATDLPTTGAPAGTPDRRALAVFADDPDARRAVAELTDELGFEPVEAGSLADSWRVERDTPAYCVRMDAETLRRTLAGTTRVEQEA